MREMMSLLCLVVFLGIALPAQAQLREDVREQRAPTKLFDQGGAGFLLNKIFSPEQFRMSHTYEMSMGAGGGQNMSMGMYTNTMQWQFSDKLAARMDVGFAHSLFGNQAAGLQSENGLGGRVFLRNAEVAYRPTKNTMLHLSIQQSPYGSYMSPYGYAPYGYSPYHYGSPFGPVHSNASDLFWNDRAR